MKSIRSFLIRAKYKKIDFSFDLPESIFGIEKRTFLRGVIYLFYFCFKKLSFQILRNCLNSLLAKQKKDVCKRIFFWTLPSIKIA